MPRIHRVVNVDRFRLSRGDHAGGRNKKPLRGWRGLTPRIAPREPYPRFLGNHLTGVGRLVVVETRRSHHTLDTYSIVFLCLPDAGDRVKPENAFIARWRGPPHYPSKGVVHLGLSCAGLFICVLTKLEGLQGRVGSVRGSPGVCRARCGRETSRRSSYWRPSSSVFPALCVTATGGRL